MQKSFLFSSRRHRVLAVSLLGVAPLLLSCQRLQAQTTSAAASAGADPTATTFYTSTTYLDLEGPGTTTHAEFGVLDFPISLLNPSGQMANGLQNNQITLQFVESNAAFTAPSTLEFYLTTATGVSIAAGSPLRYQTANGTSAGPNPYGIDPLLGSIGGSGSTALFDLGSGTTATTGATGNGTVDTYTLTLSSGALAAFLGELNTAGSTLRLVAAVTAATPTGAATFAGVTNSTVANRPTLSFAPTFGVTNGEYWHGANGGSWTPTGTTNWNTSASGAGTTQWDNGGTATAIFANAANTVNISAGNINAAGVEFDVDGYTINGMGTGNTLTLTGNHAINVVNATDTATVTVPVAGTVGLAKIGAGTLVLGGQNTYTGTTTIASGTLSISTDANLGAAGGAVALGGGTLQTTGSLTLARAFTGSGGLGVAAGSTLTIPSVVNMGTLTLPGGGTVLLTNTDFSTLGTANNAFTGVTFQTAGASLQTQNAVGSGGLGVVNLGTGGITAAQTSGTVGITANFNVTGTVPISVANAGTTLNLTGAVSGAAVLAKTGVGTLVINSDNSGLTGSGATTPVSFRQGTVGTTPVSGGVVSIVTATNPGSALGNGEFQANGGTISNDTGAAITLTITDISLGAPTTTAAPGGLIFAGSGGITVTGPISLYKGATNIYQHAVTVNTPTTFSGVLTASANTTTSTGLTILGNSTLTLNGTAPNTMKEPVTIATSGTGAGVIAAAEGAFAGTTAITLNAGSQLTINTGAQSGTVNTINDGALLSFGSLAGAFGKLQLSIGLGQETVGGLYLSANDGTLLAGYLVAGTYGSSQSAAQFKDDTLFSGTGVLVNLNAVPEPSAWAMLGFSGLLGVAAWQRRRAA